MNSNVKKTILIVAYCALLLLTNWRIHTEFERKIGVTLSEIDLRALGVILGGLISTVCAFHIWKRIRIALASGWQIPNSVRIIGGWPFLLLLLPLLFSYSDVTVGVDTDGAEFTRTFDYGGDLAIASALVSGFAILLFVTGINLESNLPPNE